MLFPISNVQNYNLQVSTAQELVLNTPELLEHIFQQLPIFDLLVVAQRTSRYWNSLIQASPMLQRALFFQPTSRSCTQEQTFNPLLKTSFGPFFANHSLESIRFGDGIPFDELARISSDAKRKAFVRKEATWRKMLPAQPAIKKLRLVSRTHAMGGDYERSGEVFFNDAVRMGNLYDLAHGQASAQFSSVGLSWTTEPSAGSGGSLARGLDWGTEKYGLVMVSHHTMQCCGNDEDLFAEFRSEGHEEVEIKWGTSQNDVGIADPVQEFLPYTLFEGSGVPPYCKCLYQPEAGSIYGPSDLLSPEERNPKLHKVSVPHLRLSTMSRYAFNQPSGFTNRINKITIVGAGGTIGQHISRSLIDQGEHVVTALTRSESKTELVAGLHFVKTADYSFHNSLVSALQGQEAPIITMNSRAPRDSQIKLIDAAVEAGVEYIMPNEYGADYSNAFLAEESVIGTSALEIRRYIESAGKGRTHWVALSSSFWYEFSLAGSEDRYGFDFDKKQVTLYDDGDTKICTTTWEQSGKAVAKLFALKILPENADDESLTLSDFNNKAVLISSFTVSQRDMLASVLRVSGDKEGDWTLVHENSSERYPKALESMKSADQGDFVKGFVRVLYTRAFFPGRGGDFSHKVVNQQLGLLSEDLDAATKQALKLHKEGFFLTRNR